MNPPRATGSGEIPSLNGIRALAVSLVFFSHGGLGTIVPGGLGVTIFFVLSGYLITTLMRREYSASGAIRLRAFYLRRVLRLMPPLFVVVALAALLSSISVVEGSFSPRGLLSVLFYFGNYHVIAFDFQGIPAGLGVVWSLAVEEHYYLLYPPLAIVLLRSARPWVSVAVLAMLCAAILGWRCWLALHGASAAYIDMATDTRADAILFGCLLAFWRNPVLDPAPGQGTAATVRRDWAIGAACIMLLIATLAYRDDFFRLTARYTLQSLAIVPLIYLAVARAAQAPFRWLNSRPMVYVGTISYTIYLSHQLIFYAVERHDLGWPATLALTALLTLAVAEPMRRWIEQPCARLRKQLHGRIEQHRQPRPGVGDHAMSGALTPSGAAPSAPLDVSVCIATHRRPERLGALLDDLAQQRLLPQEVIVVDNDAGGSAQAVVERARAAGAPFALHYAIERQKNVAIARNHTVEMAQGRWLAFIDDDERAPPGWLEQLAHAATRFNADGVLGPVDPVLPEGAPAWLRRGRFYDWARMASGAVIPPNLLRFGNVLLSSARLRSHSPVFDPAYGLTGGEDGDLLARLVQQGARIVWCDEAIVHEPVESARLSLRWLLLRSLRGGQDFARHVLAGRYGPLTAVRRAQLFLRALAQMVAAGVLALLCLPLGLHWAAHWLTKASANLGKLSAFAGLHYREYA